MDNQWQWDGPDGQVKPMCDTCKDRGYIVDEYMPALMSYRDLDEPKECPDCKEVDNG